MALKPDRKVTHDDINFKLDEVAEKGLLVSYNTSKAGFVKVPTAGSVADDKVAGILMIDVVNKDFSAQPENHQKLETGLSGVVRVGKVGEFVTNSLQVNAIIGAGSGAYVATGGLLSPSGGISGVTGVGEEVGHFLSGKDSDGYARVWLSLQ